MSPESKLPLGSLSARKSISKLLTFYIRGGKQFVRRYIKPSGPPSADQLTQRAVIKSRVEAWQGLSASAKAEWNTQAKELGDPWSGYTLYMRSEIMKISDLEDVDSIAGQGGKYAKVKAAHDGIEWAAAGAMNHGSLFGTRLSGHYYSCAISCASQLGRSTQSPNFLRSTPFLVPYPQTFDRIGVDVTGTGGGKLRLGIYDSNGSGLPNNLILDSGELDSSGSGAVEAVINETLPVGLYWVVHHSKISQAVRAVARAMCLALMGSDSMGNVYPSNNWYIARAYGALPDPFTPGGQSAEWSASVAVFLRKS